MRTFGCEAFVHVPKTQRRKWDTKSKKMILIGYQANSSNYRLFDPQNGQITVLRDVTFNEKNQHEDSIEEKEKNEVILPLHDKNDDSVEKDAKDEQMNQKTSDETSEQDEPRHQLRDRNKLKKPSRYEANLTTIEEPSTYEEAVTSPDANR